MILSLPMKALPDTVTWITDKQGCKVANIAPQEGESITWSGECEKGYASGEGTLTWFRNGIKTEVYEGMMVEGYAEGRGQRQPPSHPQIARVISQGHGHDLIQLLQPGQWD